MWVQVTLAGCNLVRNDAVFSASFPNTVRAATIRMFAASALQRCLTQRWSYANEPYSDFQATLVMTKNKIAHNHKMWTHAPPKKIEVCVNQC